MPLPLTKTTAVTFQNRIVSLRQHPNKAVRISQLCRCDAFLIGGVRVSVTQIFHHRSCKEVHLLQDNAQAAAQVGFSDLIDVDAIIADLAILNVIKAIDQIGNGCLPCARCPNEGNFLSRLCIKGNVMQNGLVRCIAKIHMVKHNAPLQLGIGQRSIVMRMLPRPHSGMFFRFPQLAIRFLDIHQRYITFVCFRLLIHECKDARGACQGGDNGIELIGNLRDGVVEIAGKRQERSDCAKCQRPRSLQANVGEAGNRHIAAQYRNNDILHIAQRIHHGHNGIGVAVSAGSGRCPRPVLFSKFFFCGFLVAKNLNDFLPVYHFLHITIDIGKRFLLHPKEAANLSCDHLDNL